MTTEAPKKVGPEKVEPKRSIPGTRISHPVIKQNKDTTDKHGSTGHFSGYLPLKGHPNEKPENEGTDV